MNTYELTVILRSNAKTEETKAAVLQTLTKHQITVKEDQSWGTKRLAYSIDDERDGHYLHLIVECAPKSINELDKEFHINREVLRHMAVLVQGKKSA